MRGRSGSARAAVERLEGRALFSWDVGVAGGTAAPRVVFSQYSDERQVLEYRFSEDLGVNVRDVSLRLVDLETGQTVNPTFNHFISTVGRPSEVTWEVVLRRLPTGRYRATIPAASVVDQAGNRMGVDYSFEFETRARLSSGYFYFNNSAFDGRTPEVTSGDDLAIGFERRLLPGATPTLENVTGYTKGINGVAIYVDGLRDPAELGVGDLEFHVGSSPGGSEWAAAPAPSGSLFERNINTTTGTSRLMIAWPDFAIRNTWLRVSAKQNTPAQLAGDVFYLGNLVGETDGGAAAVGVVNAIDLSRVKAELNTVVGKSSRVDVNRDGRVNALDLSTVRANYNRTLALSAPPTAAGTVATVATSEDDVATAVLRD